ncbi:MAG: protein kinase [Acidimicrobiales bacterium]
MGEGSGRAGTVAGTLIAGRYELKVPLGTGGMAQVWSADDRLLSRRVAVKVLHPHLAHDPAFVQRFRREAVAAARLVHPNIVAVYDTVSDADHEAIVMELVEGTTLRAQLDELGPMDERRVRQIGRDLAGALDCAHRNGLVHRDIKPANILITPDGSVRLADFGIAKADEDPDLTVAGTLVGTAAYLAPEQVGGGRIDQRTDLYALSTVLYEAATGNVPFRGDSPAATALARLHQDPAPIADQGVRLSEGFCDAVMRNLNRAPERRFQTALDFGAALAEGGRRRAAVRAGTPGTGTPAAGTPAVAPVTAASSGSSAKAPLPKPARQRPKRSVTGRVLLGLLVIGPVLLIAALVLGSPADDATSGDGPTTKVAPIAVTKATPFDPYGDPPKTENNADAVKAIDGDPTSGWHTEGYFRRDLAPKKGVGFVLQLAEQAPLRSLHIVGSAGWTGTAYVTTDDPLAAAAPPAGDGAAVDAGSGDVTVALHSRTGRYVTIWITDLGPDRGPDGRFRVSLDEVSVTGRVRTGG